jgi:hypothetical protein
LLKRRNSLLRFILAGELCNTVQDAFVIAVEQQARERLQRLSALKRITPVDITQLSIKVHLALLSVRGKLALVVFWFCDGNWWKFN